MTTDWAFPFPSLVARFSRNTLSLLPQEIANSVYATYQAGGTPQRGFKTLQGAVDAVIARVAASVGPTFTYLYFPDIDFASHESGTGHRRVRTAVKELDREIDRLAASLPQDARVVLTADHGLLDARRQDVRKLDPADELLRLLEREPWGDGRATQFQVRAGEEAGFERDFARRFESFFLITVEDAERLELYGPGLFSALTRSRLGNRIAISKGAGVIKYVTPGVEDFEMVSHHSGLTPAEMLVPLVVA